MIVKIENAPVLKNRREEQDICAMTVKTEDAPVLKNRSEEQDICAMTVKIEDAPSSEIIAEACLYCIVQVAKGNMDERNASQTPNQLCGKKRRMP